MIVTEKKEENENVHTIKRYIREHLSKEIFAVSGYHHRRYPGAVRLGQLLVFRKSI